MADAKFHFGEQVRVRPPHPDAGALGRIMNGRIYQDGREIYEGDMSPLDWLPDQDDLTQLEDVLGEYNAHELESLDRPESG